MTVRTDLLSLRGRAILAVVTVVVIVVAGFVLRALGAAEMPLSIAANGLHHGVLGSLGDALYHWVGPVPAIIGTVVLTALILILGRDMRLASTFAVTIALSWLSVAVVKLVVDRTRPDASLQPDPYQPVQTDASYPSGHAAFLTALAVAVVLLFASRRARVIAGIIAGAIVAFAVLLLVVDGVHYLSDTLASVLWVLGVAPLVSAAWLRLVVTRVPFLRWRAARRTAA